MQTAQDQGVPWTRRFTVVSWLLFFFLFLVIIINRCLKLRPNGTSTATSLGQTVNATNFCPLARFVNVKFIFNRQVLQENNQFVNLVIESAKNSCSFLLLPQFDSIRLSYIRYFCYCNNGPESNRRNSESIHSHPYSKPVP